MILSDSDKMLNRVLNITSTYVILNIEKKQLPKVVDLVKKIKKSP